MTFRIIVKKTFIDVECAVAEDQPSLRRVKSEEHLQLAKEELKSLEEGREHNPYPPTPTFDELMQDVADGVNFDGIEPDLCQSPTELAHASVNSVNSPGSDHM